MAILSISVALNLDVRKLQPIRIVKSSQNEEIMDSKMVKMAIFKRSQSASLSSVFFFFRHFPQFQFSSFPPRPPRANTSLVPLDPYLTPFDPF